MVQKLLLNVLVNVLLFISFVAMVYMFERGQLINIVIAAIAFVILVIVKVNYYLNMKILSKKK